MRIKNAGEPSPIFHHTPSAQGDSPPVHSKEPVGEFTTLFIRLTPFLDILRQTDIWPSVEDAHDWQSASKLALL